MISQRKKPTRRSALARSILSAALPLALLVVAAALAVSGGGDSQTASTSVSLRATGPVTITNNHEGSAIFTATGKRPGQSQQGTVTIKNTGGDASYVLSESAATNSPGLNGGDIRPRLSLKIEDITSGAVTKYDSTFAGMSNINLGTFLDGESRTYRFTATFNSLGTPTSNTNGDNQFQGSSSSVGFTWTATAPDTTGTGGGGGGGTDTGGGGGVTTQPLDNGTTNPGGGTFTGSGGGGGGLPNVGLGGSATQTNPSSVTFFATCTQACSLTVGGTVSVPGGAKTYRLTKRNVQLRAGVKTKVTVGFPAKVRNAVRKAVNRRRVVTVALSLTPKNAAGASRTSTRRIRIRHR